MKSIRVLCVFALATMAAPALAAGEDEEWGGLGHALTLVQTFVRIAAQSDDPAASQKAIDDVLAGRNGEANRAFSGLLNEITAGMPSESRDKMASIGQDLAALARKEAARSPVAPGVNVDAALQARKDLTAMGLRYYDADQFRDAVRRDDALAVELYLSGQGVNVQSRGADGRSALEIARANGNERLAALLARNLPAKR
jgi:ankyrin repeat protein